MKLLTKAALVAGALALAACNNPRGGDDYSYGAGAGGAGGISSTSLGDPSDSTSIAYFNQAIGDTVQFTVDSSSLTPTAQSILSAQAQWLAQNPGYSVLVEGHADERGTREYNVALGASRAAAAQQYLMAQGVAAGRIRTVSYGKERPVEACAAQRCWDLNRRAVTVVSR